MIFKKHFKNGFCLPVGEATFENQKNSVISKNSRDQVLVRMWRKGNPFALLVGMQTGAANCGKQYGDTSKS